MVLPEIEEEGEDLNQRHSKLSLTSLLLGNLVTSFKIHFCLKSILQWGSKNWTCPHLELLERGLVPKSTDFRHHSKTGQKPEIPMVEIQDGCQN